MVMKLGSKAETETLLSDLRCLTTVDFEDYCFVISNSM